MQHRVGDCNENKNGGQAAIYICCEIYIFAILRSFRRAVFIQNGRFRRCHALRYCTDCRASVPVCDYGRDWLAYRRVISGKRRGNDCIHSSGASLPVNKWLLSDTYKFTKTPAFAAFCASVSVAITGIYLFAIKGFYANVLIPLLLETAMALFGAYFIARCLPVLISKDSLYSLSSEELTACVVTLSIALMSLSTLDIYSLSPARIIAVFVIISAARYGREATGAIAGVTLSFAVSITGTDGYFIIGAYAMGGLLAGVFSPMGRFVCAGAFIISNVASVIGFYDQYPISTQITEVMFGAFMFLFIPRSADKVLAHLFSPSPMIARVDELRKSLVMRLKFASTALSDVSGTVTEVSERLSKIDEPDLNQVFLKVENDCCKGCGLRIYCHESNRHKTIGSFLNITKIIRKKGNATTDDFDEDFSNRCCHPSDITASLHRHFLSYMAKESANKRIAEIRTVVSDQFGGLSDMLSDLATDYNTSEKYDTATAQSISEVFKKFGIITTDICCKTDKYRRMTVEAVTQPVNMSRINKAKILNELYRTTLRKFEYPSVSQSGNRTMISLSEKAELAVDYGYMQYPCSNSKVCGDSCSVFDDGKGRTVMIISDGMGSGGRAAVDSAMASGLIGRLIKAGFGFDCSLKIVNSAMLFKSTDESLATVDIMAIDLFSGDATFLKAGAADTIVKKKGRIGRAKCSNYPAGILRDVNFDKTSSALSAGDIIVMMSDGAAGDDDKWVEKELLNWHNGNAQVLSEHLAAIAKRRRDPKHEDDITVCCAVIGKAC